MCGGQGNRRSIPVAVAARSLHGAASWRSFTHGYSAYFLAGVGRVGFASGVGADSGFGLGGVGRGSSAGPGGALDCATQLLMNALRAALPGTMRCLEALAPHKNSADGALWADAGGTPTSMEPATTAMMARHLVMGLISVDGFGGHIYPRSQYCRTARQEPCTPRPHSFCKRLQRWMISWLVGPAVGLDEMQLCPVQTGL